MQSSGQVELESSFKVLADVNESELDFMMAMVGMAKEAAYLCKRESGARVW